MFAIEGFADPRELDDGLLTAMFDELERRRRLLEAALVAVIGEIERRGVHAVDGHASVVGWCRARGWSHAEATRRHQVARLAGASDDITAALSAGAVGVAQAQELAKAFANPRCGDQLPAVIPAMLEHAGRTSHREFRAVVERWVMLTDLDGANRAADWCHEHRTASIVDMVGGVQVNASGGAAAGRVLGEVFARFCDAEFAADWDTTVATHGPAACPALMPRTNRQRRFDALVAIFERAACQPPGAVAAHPLVNLVVDLHTLDELLHDGSHTPAPPPARRACETADGQLLAPAEVLSALWWGRVRRIVVDSAGVVVDVGRRRRLFTGPARDAVLLQARRCVWPGCDRASGRCQADHLDEWQADGPTAVPNGAPLCARHNRFKSSGYTTWRDVDGAWHTARPDGSEI